MERVRGGGCALSGAPAGPAAFQGRAVVGGGEAVAGVRGYTAIGALPETVELAVICVPAARVTDVAEESLSAKSFDELLNTLPSEERSKVLKAISDPKTWGAIKPATGAAIMGATAETPEAPPINNLAPGAQNQNALAR